MRSLERAMFSVMHCLRFIGHGLSGVFLSILLRMTVHADGIPFPATIDAAAANLPNVSDISETGLVGCNGIRLRFSENDCRDMRINTEDSAPLPTVDVAKQTFTGEQGEGPPIREKEMKVVALRTGESRPTIRTDHGVSFSTKPE